MIENENSTGEQYSEDSQPKFEKIWVDKIPNNKDIQEIELKVVLNYGGKKCTKTYEITYTKDTPSGDKKLPYMLLTINSNSLLDGKKNSQSIKLRFTNKAKLEILEKESVGLLGGGFVLYDVDGSGKGLALSDDDADKQFEGAIIYQTFSNFDAASFVKDYLFDKDGKVTIDLTIGGKSVGKLWSQDSTTNGREWKHMVPSYAGLSENDLQNVTGIDDAAFCHNNLFIAGAASFESVLKMASIAIDA